MTGEFLSPNTPINFTMIEGEPFLLPCPPRAYSYPRVEYEWIRGTGQPISNSFGPRILTEPNGDLLFSWVEASDFFTFMNPLEAPGGLLTPLRCRARGLFLDTVLGPPVYFYVNSTSGKKERKWKAANGKRFPYIILWFTHCSTIFS